MTTAGCPRCHSVVAVHEGRPFVSARGVELWHRACWEIRDQPIVDAIAHLIAPPLVVPPRRRPVIAVASTAAVFALALAGWASTGSSASASLANVEIAAYEPISPHEQVTSNEIVPPRPPRVRVLQDRFAVPMMDDEALDVVFPSLRGWIHPVAASTELVPVGSSRHFGLERIGIERPECGAGHCGIDLDGPRGRPIVAVAAGNVVRVEHSELGMDGRSGRYVRIGHDDGTLTAYMHLDQVAEGIKVGDRVDAGQLLGTLGATAVFSAPPHLHFTLEVPRHAGMRGDHADTEYVDPAPFLVRARIAPAPGARAIKPAF